jgi:hypothetical protein
MKSKIFIIITSMIILMFLSFSMSWAHDSKYRSHPKKSYKHNNGHKGGDLNHQRFMPLTKEQRRFERAKRKAWADGKLTYGEMRRLHQFEKKAIKSLHRSKHIRVPYHHKKRNHISYGHKWYAFPRFSIMFSFSEPNSHVAGSFGVR